ncbi:MAG: hypothetical protein E3K37_12215 [Candidatus Kuenenia sp.]|nr:hypothetical protein [Candidatus Kuenenia hertensis]
MEKCMPVGILREKKHKEHRVPLTPSDVAWLVKQGIPIEVESSTDRIFSDTAYKKAGAKIVDQCHASRLLVGIKEPSTESLKSNTAYMVFSHTIKGQSENLPLLKKCIDKNISLIDYERIVDRNGRRLVFFGKYAGICGAVDSLFYLGEKYESNGIRNPFTQLKPAHMYKNYAHMQKAIVQLAQKIRSKGFHDQLSPFIIGFTGHGNVSTGVREVLKLLKPVEIHPKDLQEFVQKQKNKTNTLYLINFYREEKFRKKDQKGFYFEEYLRTPQKFESNLEKYLPYINLLLHTSYWEQRFPRLVTKEMIHRIGKEPYRLAFIGDISCDVNGSIELTYKTTTQENPVYTYNPAKRTYTDGFKTTGITILARDNLPSELPKDASEEFSDSIKEYVYQIAVQGNIDIANNTILPGEIRRAVITQGKKLTKPYAYLKKNL